MNEKDQITIKSFLYSNTVRAGAIVVLGAVVDAIMNGGDFRTVAIAAIGALIIYLRKITSTGMDFSLTKEKVVTKK